MDEQKIDRRLSDPWREAMSAKVNSLDAKVETNTALTEKTASQVAEVHSLLTALDGAFTVFKWIATAIKYLGFMAGGAAAIYGLLHMNDASHVGRIDIPK